MYIYIYIYNGFVWTCMCVRVCVCVCACVCACVCVCGCVTACVSARLLMCAHLSACRVELYNDHSRLQMHVSSFVTPVLLGLAEAHPFVLRFPIGMMTICDCL